jgi:hypothetical protein
MPGGKNNEIKELQDAVILVSAILTNSTAIITKQRGIQDHKKHFRFYQIFIF